METGVVYHGYAKPIKQKFRTFCYDLLSLPKLHRSGMPVETTRPKTLFHFQAPPIPISQWLGTLPIVESAVLENGGKHDHRILQTCRSYGAWDYETARSLLFANRPYKCDVSPCSPKIQLLVIRRS